eukprot:m.306910 g.306910  ORF g.306910 m.306910 type:complete len:50 (+) comp41703_c0_seq1:1598-1747(+)
MFTTSSIIRCYSTDLLICLDLFPIKDVEMQSFLKRPLEIALCSSAPLAL